MGNKLVHWEIPVLDTNKAKEFYGKVFDWKFQSWGDADDYTLFVAAEDNGGALMKVDKMPAEPAIRVYIDVADIPAILKKVEELGGKTGQPKSEIGGGMGFAGSFIDPWGCLIGLWSKT
jgi:uncharacterized protein